MRIGEIDIEASRPGDLEAQLLAGTGFGVHEVERLIGATPATAARALAPFAADVPVGVLAAAIDADPDARDTIRALYADIVEVPE